MSVKSYVSGSLITNSHEATIPLAIADDYPLLIFGVQRLLAACQDIVVVAECIGFGDLIAQVALKRPKIILLGCETNADTLSQQLLAIAEHDSEAKVIVFTGNQNLKFHEEALRNGARGVVLKHCAPELIARSVRKVHRGDLCFDRALTDRMLRTFVRRKQPELPPEAANASSLTGRESQIMRRICQGMRTKEIAYELQISNATVAHNLTSIYRKLGLADRTELLLFAHRNQTSPLTAVSDN